MKIFLEIAFISNQPPELAGFPSLFDRIKCCEMAGLAGGGVRFVGNGAGSSNGDKPAAVQRVGNMP